MGHGGPHAGVRVDVGGLFWFEAGLHFVVWGGGAFMILLLLGGLYLCQFALM